MNLRLCMLFCLLSQCLLVKGQNDLPVPTPNLERIGRNSLIIPMDNATQSLPGYFNLKAYGLVNLLLQNNIPVKWAIRSGKGKDSVDFRGRASRPYPTSVPLSPNWIDFKAGPFIVDSLNSSRATNIISTSNYANLNNVAVYQLVQGLNVDIRYTLTFKPRPVVCSNGGNQAIHTAILAEAGFPTANYSVLPAGQAVPLCGYTIASEPHWGSTTRSDTSETFAVYRFVRNGGNFFAQCKGVETYENYDTLQTTSRIITPPVNISVTAYDYRSADLPIMQFDGPLAIEGGSVDYWTADSGLYRSTTYTGIQTQTRPPYQTLTGAKVINNILPGGNVFYLGGHNYSPTNINSEINGRRIYLNAVMVPPGPAVVCATTLPVELLYFDATGGDQHVALQWETGSEINNDYFLLERSKDGREWDFVARIPGNGTTTELHHYDYTDREPLHGISYYRLSQFDFDGHFERYPPVSATVGAKSNTIKLYPNPVSDRRVFVQFPARTGAVKCTVQGAHGESLLDFIIESPGEESFTYTVDLPHQFCPGVYTFHFVSDQYEQTDRVTVLK